MAHHILVVDDDETTRLVLAGLFEDEGYVVHVAADGRQALSAIADAEFDVLLTDIAMPRMDGRELAQTLRSQAEALPIVVMSSSRTLAETAAAMDAQAYVAKPFDFDLLLATVKRVIEEA